MSFNDISTVKRAKAAIALPFTVSPTGGILSTTDVRKVWADRVLSVVGTALDERIMRPGYGADIPSLLFKNVDNIQEDVDREVTKAFSLYLESLNFLESLVNLDEVTNTLEIEIMYTLPDETQDRVVLGSISILDNTIIDEVIL